MAGIFGTDGVRARINTGPMRAEAVVRLALAAGRWFVGQQDDKLTTSPLVVIGKDTRLSGYMLEAAMVAGFSSIGMECKLLGPVPTAAVSVMTKQLGGHLGVMISASHNPYHDNGIKLFGPDGQKLVDTVESEISQLMAGSIALAQAEQMGRVRRILDSADHYTKFACQTVSDQQLLKGKKIVVDCAHGAAYVTAPKTLSALGAEVIALCDEPDGLNINDHCGAVYPEVMAKAVIEHKADMGLALDGDADRLIIADELGAVHKGDRVLGVIASHRHKTGQLRGNVIGTLMTNLGLEIYLAEQNIGFARAKVGDRYILEMLNEQGGNLGGEGSGHILMPDICPSGDGLMAALQLFTAQIETDKPLSQAMAIYDDVPQKLVNLKDMNKAMLADERITSFVETLEADLAGQGRILLRPSGTEPLIRVMVEARDESKLDKVMAQLVSHLEAVNHDYLSQDAS